MTTPSSAYDVLLIIPTVAKSEVLLPSFDLLVQNLDGLKVHIVASVNPLDDVQAEASIAGMRHVWKQAGPEECRFTIYHHPEACGFGGAINRGLRIGTGDLVDIAGDGQIRFDNEGGALGLPTQLVVIWNDDLRVTDGWLKSMIAAMHTEEVTLLSEVPNEDGKRPIRSAKDYGRIGMVGPMTNVAAGIQVIGQNHREQFETMGLAPFAAWWREKNEGMVYTATFLSGYCMGFHPAMVQELMFTGEDGLACLFDERYLIAGYEDNDLCVRADRAGWRAAVAYDAFIGHLGHQTFDSDFPEMERGMRNRGVYYDVWRPQLKREGNKLVAAFRVRLDVPNDVNMFRMAIAGISKLVNGIAILLTGDLARMKNTSEWALEVEAGTLPGDARELAENGRDTEVEALWQWARGWSVKIPGTLSPEIKVHRWAGEFNERDERNYCLDMARGMGADWIISVDHDENIEPRVERAHLDRLMAHPDPMVQEWDFSWINHWANNRWQNITRPWGDAGSYTGGMHGFRMFRVNPTSPRQIQAGGENGLHCGNIPMVGPVAKRVSGIRFRHFGYMRHADRVRKLGRYEEQDPTPNPVLVGGTSYAHITHEENQLMSAFAPVNGIGVHCLMYEGENAGDLGRNLDQLYALADRVVVVWTGEWSKRDRRRLYGDEIIRHEGNKRGTLRPQVDLWAVDEWPSTGPSREVARMAEHFSVEWVHEPLNDNLSNARNAGIDALHGTTGMGWGFFFDPDEHLPANAAVGLRRMAEVTDAWGWLFRFVNQYADGGSNLSEAVRMHRLDERGIMRMSGRVHESFERATRYLVEQGYGRVIRKSPDAMVMINSGLALEPSKLQAKLDRYRRLVELDLRENPINPGGWTTLGLFWGNEGYNMVAMECFSRGMVCATGQFLPFQEAGTAYLRLARLCYAEAGERMGGHERGEVARAVVDFIDKAAPPMPILGVPGQTGMTEAEALESLPPAP